MPAKGIQELRPALIAIGFLAMPAMLFDFQLKAETLLAGFFAAFAVYLADHLLPAGNKGTWPLIGLCSTAFAGFAWRSQQFSFPGLLFYIFLALVYVLPLLPGKKRLQDIPILRVIAIVTGWACIPMLLMPFPYRVASVIYLVGVSAFMFPAVLWSDLADRGEDQKSGRLTWSTQLQTQKRTSLILCTLLLSGLCFSLPGLRIMLPAPLLYLFNISRLNRHPHHSDWVLLWPFIGSFSLLLF